MLFDLRGKRKRLIQVIYVGLALLMGVGLVGLGIGGDASGGIFDALGIGSSGTQTTDPAYDKQIEKAETTLQTKPNDERALLLLARTHFLAGQAGVETDENGQPTVTEEALAHYSAATDAWERYLDTKPKEPDSGVANLMIRAYSSSAGADPATLQSDLDNAFKAAQIVAEERPSVGTNTQLATYAYLAGETKIAKQAEKDALAEADSATKSQIKAQFRQAEQQGKQIAKQAKQTAPDKTELQNPLGGVGSGTAPAAP